MDEQQLRREQEVENRKQMMLDVQDGSQTVYWQHLEWKIKSWIKAEEKYINTFTRLKDSEDMADLNMAHERLAVLKQFLRINQTILEENKNFINSMVATVKEAFQYVKTFVGK